MPYVEAKPSPVPCPPWLPSSAPEAVDAAVFPSHAPSVCALRSLNAAVHWFETTPPWLGNPVLQLVVGPLERRFSLLALGDVTGIDHKPLDSWMIDQVIAGRFNGPP